MHAPTAERVHNTRHAHCGERDCPNDCSPTAADVQRPDYDNRDSSMTKLPFAGATALITIKKNSCPYPAMSSCTASSCMSFPKALSAFATLASSPTGAAPLSCRFALTYSEQYSHRRPNQKPPLPRNRPRFGSAPNAAAPWRLSRDLRLPSSNSVLHPSSPEPPHETTNPNLLWRCASPPVGVVRSPCPQTRLPASNLHPKSCSYHPQSTSKPILPALLFAPHLYPMPFSPRPHH